MNDDHTTNLPADRAFVVQISAGDALAGRVEHITSGATARFQSWNDLRAFVESQIGHHGEANHAAQ